MQEVVTFAEYLAREARSTVKHEYLGGYMYPLSDGPPDFAARRMAACTDDESARAMAIGALLFAHLRGRRARVYNSDLRIRVRATGFATYADVSVVCEAPAFDRDDPEQTTITNPQLLVEVLGASAAHDRDTKLAHYRLIPSVREIVLVAHDRPEIEVHSREADDGWRRDIYRAGESARLRSIELDLALDEVYRDPMA